MAIIYLNDNMVLRLAERDIVQVNTEDGPGFYPITNLLLDLDDGSVFISDNSWTHNWIETEDDSIFETPRAYGERMIAAIKKRGWVDLSKWEMI
ncbi:hypothetical protein VPHD479_0172 [Vibrio phage D479]